MLLSPLSRKMFIRFLEPVGRGVKSLEVFIISCKGEVCGGRNIFFFRMNMGMTASIWFIFRIRARAEEVFPLNVAMWHGQGLRQVCQDVL